MSYPVGMDVVEVTAGNTIDFFGENIASRVTVSPIIGDEATNIIWEATGQPVVNRTKTIHAKPGQPLVFTVPNPDQDGFLDGSGNVARNWAYVAIFRVGSERWTKTFQPIAGQTSIDLDLVPNGEITEQVSAPLPPVTSVNGQTGAVSVTEGLTEDQMVQKMGDAEDPVGSALFAASAEVVGERVVVAESSNPWNGEETPRNTIVAPGNGSAINPASHSSVILNSGRDFYNNIIGGDGTNTVGEEVPNVVDPTIQASVSVVGGYDNVAGAISSKIISDHSYTAPGVLGHHGIFGGTGHVAGPLSGHAGIIGGRNNFVNGWSDLVGGQENTIEGNHSVIAGQGNRNTERVNGMAIFGMANTADATGAVVAGQNNAVLPGAVNSMALGSNNRASGTNAVALGARTEADLHHSLAYGNGGFNQELGSAQRIDVTISARTTTATAAFIGPNAGSTFRVPTYASWAYELRVVAVDEATGDTAAWTATGAIKRDASVTTNVGTPTITRTAADTAAETWALQLAGTSASGLFDTRVKGQADKNIRWVGHLSVTQVKRPTPAI